MVTPGIKARVASDTVPPNVAFVVCANVFATSTDHSNAPATKSLFMISSSGSTGEKVDASYYAAESGVKRCGLIRGQTYKSPNYDPSAVYEAVNGTGQAAVPFVR